jgi:hypothetical protein
MFFEQKHFTNYVGIIWADWNSQSSTNFLRTTNLGQQVEIVSRFRKIYIR